MSDEPDVVAPLQAAEAAYDGPAGSLLRIAESLESEANAASRAGQAWSLNQLAQELRGAHKDVTFALRRLTQQRNLARADAAAAENTIQYVTESLAEDLDDAGHGHPETLPDCLELLHEVLNRTAAQPPTSEASPE